MSNKFLVILEQRNGSIKKSSIEVVSVAVKLAAKLNAQIEAVVLGNSVENIKSVAEHGIESVTFFKNDNLKEYSSSAYTKIITKHISDNAFTEVFISNTALGKDLAPRISAKLDCGLVMDCTALDVEGTDIIATRPIFAGKMLMKQKLTSNVKVFNLRPNAFGISEVNAVSLKLDTKEVGDLDLSVKTVEVKKNEGKLDVAEADIIVSGGRGLKGPENFHLIEKLANELNAAVGASRAVVDAGWRPHSEQVGQTGKTVSPNLYIAVGISGAIQHVAGMRSSKYIVAINKDKDAPIFQIADYGMVADAFEVLPSLIEEVKKIKQ
jgi:electron transfer flavoprotein alpha subunit